MPDNASSDGVDLGKLVTQDAAESFNMLKQLHEFDTGYGRMFTNSDAMAEEGSLDTMQALLSQVQQGGPDGLAAARELEGTYLLGCGVISQESSGSDVNFLSGDDLFGLSDLENGEVPNAAVLQCYYVWSEEPTFETIDSSLSGYVPGAGCYMYSYESSDSSSTDSPGIVCYYRGDDWAGSVDVFASTNFEADGTQYAFYTLALSIANSTDKSGQFEHYSFTYDNDTEGQSGPVVEDDYYYRPIGGAAQATTVATTSTSSGVSSSSSSSGGNAASVDVDWRTLSKIDELTYNGGFKIEIDVKMSPFIKKDDTATLQAVWSQVSGGQPFPKDSQFHNVSVSHWDEAKNIYYAVGELSAKNATEGFDLPTDGSIWFTVDSPSLSKNVNSGSTHSARLLMTDQNLGSGTPSLTMRGETLGPIPVVFAVYENITPNEPDGCDIASTKLNFFGEQAVLGLMGDEEI